jgi:hypothetical protein
VLFNEWETFYVIVGSSAAALTGLMFVVVALVADFRTGSGPAMAAFSTPTVVHLGSVLWMSAIMTAPWPSTSGPQLLLAATGTVGVGYAVMVLRLARRQKDYKPVFEDWLFHFGLPFLAYAAVLVSGFTLERAHLSSLFAVGGANVLLLFVGIHNAWDTVTYIVLQQLKKRSEEGDSEQR